MTQPTLLLVDASSFVYRAFHAMPDLRSRSGAPTGAVTGVINMLRRVRDEWPASHIACVFDPSGPTFRDAIYPEYKANRSAMPDELRSQLPLIFDAVRALGWPLVVKDGLEADDVIGSLARQAQERGMRTVIATGDKDLAQLVNEQVCLIDTMSRDGGPTKVTDAKAVFEKFGVRPDQMIDYLTLVGDAVDNVPGVEKVGPKTAAKWLAEYGSLDAIVENADRITGVVGENLRAAREWLPTARVLVTVKCDADLSELVTSFDEHLAPQPLDAQGLQRLRDEFDLSKSLRGLIDGDVGARGSSSAGGPSGASGSAGLFPGAAAVLPTGPGQLSLDAPLDVDYQTVLTQDALAALIDQLQKAPLVAFDTETTSLDVREAALVGLSFSWAVGQAVYIPVGHRYAGAPDQLPLGAVLDALRPWLENHAHAKLGQNLKYDAHVLAHHGVEIQGIAHDTLLQSYVLEAHRSHDLGGLAERHLGRKGLSYDDVTGKGASRIGFEEVSIEVASRYSCEDADFTFHLHTVLWPQIEGDGRLHKMYCEIELPVLSCLLEMEANGIRVDGPMLLAQSDELAQQIQHLEGKAHDLAGGAFNLGSPKQLAEILFERLGYTPVKKTAKGAPSTDEDVLEQLAHDYPLPKVLLEWRALSKLKSTYTDKLPRMVDAGTGRVHTTFSQAVAVTGRLASSEPNLQNIPIRTAEGRRIRKAFVAADGHVLMSADYSQIELRIMAHLSGDEGLVGAFSRGEDVHRATASEIFGVDRSEVSDEQRRYAKVINFGLIYGMSAFGLAQNLDIERSAAKTYIERYFARYPGVARYMETIKLQARSQGYVETVFGRRLWLPEIASPNGPRRAAAERAAINAPMQGTAADLIKLAMIAMSRALKEKGLRSKMLLQVHDELIFEVPTDEIGLMGTLVPEHMQNVAQLTVPLLVSVGTGPNWDDAH